MEFQMIFSSYFHVKVSNFVSHFCLPRRLVGDIVSLEVSIVLEDNFPGLSAWPMTGEEALSKEDHFTLICTHPIFCKRWLQNIK